MRTLWTYTVPFAVDMPKPTTVLTDPLTSPASVFFFSTSLLHSCTNAPFSQIQLYLLCVPRVCGWRFLLLTLVSCWQLCPTYQWLSGDIPHCLSFAAWQHLFHYRGKSEVGLLKVIFLILWDGCSTGIFHGFVTFTPAGADRLMPAGVCTTISGSLMFISEPVTTQYS